jgi:LAO/AO transport system kinase
MLADRILKGDLRAASRLMRDIDDRVPGATAELRALFPATGRSRIVGITGSPGAGKSTLTDRLVGHYRSLGKTVGVVCVDPTSPFSGGAILGDRIRMQGHATDPGVFIRSLATRGNLGGLSRATSDVIRIMDAMGKDVVLVETVGVGQDEVDVAQLAHTTVVVVVPGMGDDIQAIKAGILEVADVFAVNKADREGADRTVRELRAMLELRAPLALSSEDLLHHLSHEAPRAEAELSAPAGNVPWEPPIVKTIATRDGGILDLLGAIAGHEEHLLRSGALPRREANRARSELVSILRDRLLDGALEALSPVGTLDEIASRIARRELDPYALAEDLAGRLRGGAFSGEAATRVKPT